MSRSFEELDYRPTPMGALSLRRRSDPSGGPDIHEIKLGEAFLMSSRFTTSEIALAEIGLAEAAAPRAGAVPGDRSLDVIVGGLGLGYTAVAALRAASVGRLVVIETFADVIDWHRLGLVPNGKLLADDARCRLVEGDFFALAADPQTGFDPDQPGRRFDAILLDIDHSPADLLHASHSRFYQAAGLGLLAAQLKPGGVFALWSNDPLDEPFLDRLRQVFTSARAEVIRFDDARAERTAASTIYLARKAG